MCRVIEPAGTTLLQSWLVHSELPLDRILMATLEPDMLKVHAVCVVVNARSISIGWPAMPLGMLGVTWMLEAGQGPLGTAFGFTAWLPATVGAAVVGVVVAVRGVVLADRLACGVFDPPPLNNAMMAISTMTGVPNTTARRRQ